MRRGKALWQWRLAPLRRGDVAVLLACAMVGVAVGLVGVAFRGGITLLNVSWRERLVESAQDFGNAGILVSIAISGVGFWLAALIVRRFAPEAGGSGVQEIEGALEGLRTVRWARAFCVKFVGGLLALGAGGAMGREGPTIHLGASVGQAVSSAFRLSLERAHVLLAAGAAAGLSTAFNAPISSILFVIEEMRLQFRFSFLSLQGVGAAALVADVVTRALTGSAPVVAFPAFEQPPLESLWLFIVFGALMGAVGVVFNRTLLGTLKVFDKLPAQRWGLGGLVSGVIVGTVAWFVPLGVSGGYGIIDSGAVVGFPLLVVLGLVLLRWFTTLVSYGSGAPGGIFAPMLALGVLLGHGFSFLGRLVPHADQPGLFAVAGMVCIFSSTVRAPVTGLILAAEMTGEFQLMLSLATAAFTATAAAESLGGKPVYTLLLERTLQKSGQAPRTVQAKPPAEPQV